MFQSMLFFLDTLNSKLRGQELIRLNLALKKIQQEV